MPGKKLSYFERALSLRARTLIFDFPLEFLNAVFFRNLHHAFGKWKSGSFSALCHCTCAWAEAQLQNYTETVHVI
jgi:uncharacterized iron-regulated membrane protein